MIETGSLVSGLWFDLSEGGEVNSKSGLVMAKAPSQKL